MDFEIDDGAPRTPRPSAAIPTLTPPGDEASPIPDDHLKEARLIALRQQHDAILAGHVIDALGTILIALCAEGLFAIVRIEEWSMGVVVALTASLVATVLAVKEWRHARHPGQILRWLPEPTDLTAEGRTAPQSDAQLLAARQRCADDIATIELSFNDLTRRRRHISFALAGAGGGAIIGWLTGAFGPPGASGLAASTSAAAGMLMAGRLADGAQWPEIQTMRLMIGAIPGLALVMAVLVGTPVIYALGGWAIAVVVVALNRQRLLRLASI